MFAKLQTKSVSNSTTLLAEAIVFTQNSESGMRTFKAEKDCCDFFYLFRGLLGRDAVDATDEER